MCDHILSFPTFQGKLLGWGHLYAVHLDHLSSGPVQGHFLPWFPPFQGVWFCSCQLESATGLNEKLQYTVTVTVLDKTSFLSLSQHVIIYGQLIILFKKMT